jgi:2-polyprenyl-3-methyl-5-hydroxy-6-metoxy-1,4-benzoquinol methylase
MDFSRRSYKKELLDGDNIPFADIERNMLELEVINKHLGGHRISLQGFGKLAGQRSSLSICEIGCGGGDNLLAISKKYSHQNMGIKMIGIDINPDCISVARKKFPGKDARFIVSDYKEVQFDQHKPDIIFASLFCHHFTDAELQFVLQWMNTNAGLGFFINDLHRSPLAYYSIRMLTSIFSRSYLVKNDAPLSVLRGFRKKEWKELLEGAGIFRYSIKWKWAFRWLIVIRKHN